MSTQTRYRGENGLEYLTEKDAKKYGGGLAEIVEYTPPKVTKIKPEPTYDTLKSLGDSQEKEEVKIPTTEELEKGSLEDEITKDEKDEKMTDETYKLLEKLKDAPIETLKNAAKNLKLKGYHNCKRETLYKKVEEALIAQG